MFGAFWVASPVFGTWENVRSILELTAPILILATGLTIVLTTGEFDLSFPGIVGLAAVGAVQMMAWAGQDATVAVAAGVATGVAAGVVAGVLVSFQRTSSFIVTLALSGVWSGVALGVSNGGATISDVTDGYVSLTLKAPLGIPLSVIYAVAIAVLGFVVARWTVFGRHAEAIGSNATAARLAGIRLVRTRVAAFAAAGLCAGIAGVVLSSQTAQFAPGLAGGLFIPPFVAAFFGISVLAAGKFNVFGTVVGALFVSTLQTGLIIQGAQAWSATWLSAAC